MSLPKIENIDVNFYKIDTNKEIPELSSFAAKAYEVNTSDTFEEKRSLYALIFENFFPTDRNLISSFQKGNIAGIPKVVSQGLFKYIDKNTKLMVEKYTAILEKPTGIPLKEYVLYENKLVNSFEAIDFAIRLIKLVLSLHEKGVVHCCLNNETIFVEPLSGRISIKEFFSEYPGYSQKPEYESLEQLEADKAGKNYHDYQTDYYAVGVIVAFVFIRRELRGEKSKEKDVFLQKLQKGTIQYIFDFLAPNQTLPSRITNLLRGLLNDIKENIWSKKKIEMWLKGSEVTFQSSNIHKETLTPFEFSDNRYYSLKYLAHDIFLKKDIARKNLNLVELHRWVNNALREKNKADEIQAIYKSKSSSFLQMDHIYKIIMILDPSNLRFEDKVVNINGFRNFFIQFSHENSTISSNFLKRFLDSGLITLWLSLHDKETGNHKTSIGFDPKSIRHFFNIKSVGFDSERAIYDLSEDLPCQSSIFNEFCITTKRQLMETLDKVLASGKKVNFDDNHIAAFLTNRLNIMDELQIKSLRQYQELARHNVLLMTLYLALAQNDINKTRLPHVASWVAKNLEIILTTLHNNKTKKHMGDKLIGHAREGDIAKLNAVITSSRYIRVDKAKFKLAKKSYNNLCKKLFILSDKNLLRRKSILYGLIVSAKLAYTICIATILYSFLRIL